MRTVLYTDGGPGRSELEPRDPLSQESHTHPPGGPQVARVPRAAAAGNRGGKIQVLGGGGDTSGFSPFPCPSPRF